MLLAWTLMLIGGLVVGKYAVRTAKELEQQADKKNQDSHQLVA